MKNILSTYLTVLSGVTLTAGHPSSPSQRDWKNVIHVSAGKSIQSAINSAQAGTWIIVEAGTYAEQLTISTNDISLVGHGATLVPPAKFISNTCTGLAGNQTNAGICVTGSGIKLADYVQEHRKVLSVASPVKDVSIFGFTVSGFDGENVAVVGGQNVHVNDNTLLNGGMYGFLAVGSPDTLVAGNKVTSETNLRFIGICNDNPSGARVFDNHISGYSVALCVQTSGANIAHNDVVNCCVGAFIDPAINGAQVTGNHIGATNPACVGSSPVNGGIIIYGATNSVVKQNTIQGQHAGGMAGGIIVVDAVEIGPGLVAAGNTITDNVLIDNDFDIFVNTTGTGNVIARNKCTLPKELCG